MGLQWDVDQLPEPQPTGVGRADLIAQLVIQPVVRAQFVQVGELDASARGAGGHGSTGGIQAWAGDMATGPSGARLAPTAEGE